MNIFDIQQHSVYLENQVNINEVQDGQNALVEALYSKNFEQANWLIKEKINLIPAEELLDPDYLQNIGVLKSEQIRQDIQLLDLYNAYFYMSLCKESPETQKRLIETYFSELKPYDGATKINICLTYQAANFEILKSLSDKGHPLFSPFSDINNPENQASALNKMAFDHQAWGFLVSQGLPVNGFKNDIELPLLFKVNKTEDINKLLDLGADVNYTPLNFGNINALFNANLEKAKILIENNIDIHHISKPTIRENVLFHLPDETLEFLLNKGIDINHQNQKKYTVLMNAVSSNDLSRVSLLLEKGADINLFNRDNYNCLMLSTDIEMSKLLLKYKPDLTFTVKNNYLNTEISFIKFLEEKKKSASQDKDLLKNIDFLISSCIAEEKNVLLKVKNFFKHNI